ncbi:MAG: Flagellar M-ring protein [Synergistales bacterium 53_16]|nr:MAG: Flagellar M-ring protein [Synergistales bacterium 53_16]
MDQIKELAKRFTEFLNGLEKRRRWTLLGVVVVLLGFFGGVIFLAGRTSYVPLFSGLDTEDQAAIVEMLKEKGVEYRLEPSAAAVLVPESRVHELRLNMASDGLPKGGAVGFEIFDNTKMGMTDFEQRVAYVRALEGELARTIRQMDAVEGARVSVVLPKPKLFLKEEQPASASILLKLKPGREMTAEQVRAVMNLTASSVEGLSPEHVSVVDTRGRLLSEMVEEEFFIFRGANGGVSSLQRELERQHEHDLEKRVRNMLTAIFGPGNAVVRVQVELDFTRLNRSRRQFVPMENGRGVVRSSQATEETWSGQSAAGQGVGTAANIPGYAVQTATTGGGEYSKTEEITNYEISTIQEEISETPGSVKRMTASVVINGNEASVPVEELYSSVAAALGLDENRGDRLTLSFMPFAVSAMEGFADFETAGAGIFGRLPWILAAAVAGGALIFLLWRRRAKRRRSPEEARLETEGTRPKAPDLFNVQKDEVELLEEQLGLYAQSNPEDVAAIILQWLEES